MVDYKFSPKVLTIKKGDTVTWTNTVRTMHNVQSETKDKDLKFRSKFLRKGRKFSHKFTHTGNFGYYCTPHKRMGMVGTIIVEEK